MYIHILEMLEKVGNHHISLYGEEDNSLLFDIRAILAALPIGEFTLGEILDNRLELANDTKQIKLVKTENTNINLMVYLIYNLYSYVPSFFAVTDNIITHNDIFSVLLIKEFNKELDVKNLLLRRYGNIKNEMVISYLETLRKTIASCEYTLKTDEEYFSAILNLKDEGETIDRYKEFFIDKENKVFKVMYVLDGKIIRFDVYDIHVKFQHYLCGVDNNYIINSVEELLDDGVLINKTSYILIDNMFVGFIKDDSYILVSKLDGEIKLLKIDKNYPNIEFV